MTRFNYWKCDECGKVIENCECSPKQLMYTLLANYDADSWKAHFCSHECLNNYVDKKVKEHHDLPTVSDGERDKEQCTFGEYNKERERDTTK